MGDWEQYDLAYTRSMIFKNRVQVGGQDLSEKMVRMFKQGIIVIQTTVVMMKKVHG